MEKTKLGISVGLVGAILYCLGLFGGALVTIAAVAYVLIFEENEWLKKTAVKVVFLMFLFPIVQFAVGLIPDLARIVVDFLNIFKVYPDIAIVYAIENLIYGLVNIAKYVVFAIFCVMALSKKSVKIPLIDSLIDKHMG
jgi:uncharacterized membrane protein